MANKFLLKRGSGAPSSIDEYELVYDYTNNVLYTKVGSTITAISGGSGGGAVDSIANFADNRVLTASDADSIRGEGNLTFDGTTLAVTGALTTTSTINIGGIATFQNHIIMGDSDQLRLGSDADGYAMHTGSHMWINNSTGNLYIRNQADDKNIHIQTDDASGGTTDYMKFSGSESLIRVYKNMRFLDSVNLQLGSGNDLQLKHDGSNSYIQNRLVGKLIISNQVDDTDIELKVKDGGSQIVSLLLDASNVGRVILPNDNQKLTIGAGYDLNFYNNGSVSYISNSNDYLTIDQNAAAGMQLRNLSSDQDITFSVNDGGSQATVLQIDASNYGSLVLPLDNQNFYMGAGNDFRIVHNGTDTYLNNYTGDYIIGNYADDKDISFRTDDGSGGQTEYFRLDGSSTAIKVAKNLEMGDNVQLRAGAGDDLQIYHDGSNTSLQNNTGVFYINQTANASMSLQTNNTQALEITSAQVLVPRQDVKMQATKKLYFDGGVHTYINEDIDDRLRFFTGGLEFMRFTEGSSDLVNLYVDTYFGDRALWAGGLLNIQHSTHGYISNTSGNLLIRQQSQDSDFYISINDGGSNLNAVWIDGSETGRFKLPNDNQKLTLGASNDINLFHDASNSYFTNATGDFYFQNTADDKDIVFQSDDGSGGVTQYLRLDGGDKRLYMFNTRMQIRDDGTLHWGSAAAHGILSWDTGRAIVTATGANNLDLKAASGYQVVVNETQSNVDFRVESDTNAHLLFADASSNRIGILSSSPNATLDVAGIGQFRGTSSEAVNLYLGQTTSNAAFMYEFSTYDDAGGILNVGDHLQIKSYRWGQDISFARNGQGGAVPTARFFSSGSSGYFDLYKATDPTNNANYETRVKLNVNGNSYLNGGNIGMGLTNPDVRLHVKDASNDVYLRLETDKTNGNAQVQYYNDARSYNLGINNADKFSLWDNTASATRFDIATDGDFKFYGTGSNFESVGGGSATYLLLSGTATQRIEFRNTDSNANGWIGVPSWNTDAWHEYMPTSNGNELAYIYESSAHHYYRAMVINNAGEDYDFTVRGNSDDNLIRTDAGNDRVGIGISNPGELLHVDGSIEFAGRKYNRGSVTVTGAGTSNGQAITLSTELGTTLHVNYQYRITLNTTGTGTDTGAVYILTYDQDNSAWKLHLVSRKGSSSNHPLAVVDGSNLKVYHNHANAYNILYFVELWDMAADDGTLHGWGSDFMWTRDVNTLSYTDGKVEADIDLGSGSNTIKKTFATNNYPAVTVHSSGTGDSGAAIAIQQATTEGDTIIFADFEPHVEWGISAENGNNRIDFTGGTSSPSLGTRTFKNNSGSDRTAYRKMSVRLDNGNVDIAGNLTVANGSAYAGDSTSGVLSTGSWIGDLGSNGWERVCGVQHDGGVFSIVEKNAQISTIVDGSYFAYESGTNQGGGFYSSTSSNYANAPGIRASAASQLYVVQADGGTSDLKVSGAITVQAGDDFALGELTNTLRMKGNGTDSFNFLNDGNGWATLNANTYNSSSGFFQSDDYSTNVSLRRGPNNDDRITIEASETKIYGDSVERVRFGSYGIRNGYSGSEGGPVYSFKDDTDTGIWRSGGDTIAFSCGGTRMFSIKSDGDIELRNDGSSQGAYIERVGGIQFTWDRDTYGNNNYHAIVCDSDNLKINSYDDVVINLDSNNNDSDETFDIRKHATSMTGGTLLFQVNGDGTARATGDVVAYYSSDKKLKDNLKPISNSLEKLQKLTGYEFDWNDKQNTYEGHDVGVVAQEVEEVLPEVVATRDSGYKAVKYEKMIPLLIEAIKEQQQQINELKEKLDG